MSNDYIPTDLQMLLNYDSNVKKVFTMTERVLIHQNISRLIQGGVTNLDEGLKQKIERTTEYLRRINYTPITVRIGQDRLPIEINLK